MSSNDTEQLLCEWLTWWATAEEAPAKMPDALHVRTAVHLVQRGFDDVPMPDSARKQDAR